MHTIEPAFVLQQWAPSTAPASLVLVGVVIDIAVLFFFFVLWVAVNYGVVTGLRRDHYAG